MPRKQRAPREPTQLAIVSVHYTERDFLELNTTVMDFTNALRNRNRDLNQRELSKQEVSEQYALTLLQIFRPDEPKYLELIGQLESPVYHDFWAKLANKLEHKRKYDSTGFRQSNRKLSPADKQRYPRCIVMEHKDLGVVIAPGLSLCAMHQISFERLVEQTLDANTEIRSLHLYMRQLCVAIIHQMGASDEETGGPEQGQKCGRRNDEGEELLFKEEGNEEADAADGARSRKRQKRTNIEEGRWQSFEQELDSAGATVSAAPVSFQFADTSLPFRFKGRGL